MKKLLAQTDEWQDANGHVMILCVVHELDAGNYSHQAMCTLNGLSLCRQHFEEARARLGEQYK